MGCQSSKAVEDKGGEDLRLMYFDEYGALRKGESLRDRNKELQELLKADAKKPEEPEPEPEIKAEDGVKEETKTEGMQEETKEAGEEEEVPQVWYIVESMWIKAWLAFVHYQPSSPEPGPVANSHLLNHSDEGGWVPKPNLKPAGKATMGHYRRVNEDVWRLLMEWYPGSGPTICVREPPYDNAENWQIAEALPPAAPPEIPREGKVKGKGKGRGSLSPSNNSIYAPGNGKKRPSVHPVPAEAEEEKEQQEDDAPELEDVMGFFSVGENLVYPTAEDTVVEERVAESTAARDHDIEGAKAKKEAEAALFGY